MSEAFCKKICKGVALAGASAGAVVLGAAVIATFKKVAASSKKKDNDTPTHCTTDIKPDNQKTDESQKNSSSIPSGLSPVTAISGGQTKSSLSASCTFGSTSSLASLNKATRQNNMTGLSRNGSGSSSWDLQHSGSSVSLSSCASDLEDVVASGKWNYNWDLRDPSFTNQPRPRYTRHLFFVLHGHYISNGETNLHFLSSLGKTQLEMTGDRLATWGLPFTRIFHSSALRCKQSSNILKAHLPNMETVQDDLLLECAPESVASNQQLINFRMELDTPSASSLYEDGARIEAAFRKYIHRAEFGQKSDTYEVMVTHANVIRYFVCRALQLPPEAWLKMSLHNGSITWLSIRPDGLVFVRELGDTGHMPALDELAHPDGSLVLTKMPSKIKDWYLFEAPNSEDDYYGTVYE